MDGPRAIGCLFLTPKGDNKGLYVTNQAPGSFEVHEAQGGRSTIGFDYRIVAKRKGMESLRMEDVTDRQKLAGAGPTEGAKAAKLATTRPASNVQARPGLHR